LFFGKITTRRVEERLAVLGDAELGDQALGGIRQEPGDELFRGGAIHAWDGAWIERDDRDDVQQ
jgi:hypothetical protein